MKQFVLNSLLLLTFIQEEPSFNVFSLDQDIEIGTESAKEADKSLLLVRDAAITDYFREMGLRLARNSHGAGAGTGRGVCGDRVGHSTASAAAPRGKGDPVHIACGRPGTVTSDVELLNTEFTRSTVTFLPTFAKHGDQNFFANERAGTTIFSLTYLRNRRRGDG